MRLLLLVHLSLCSAGLADGIALQRHAAIAPMPAQCALLAWKDGVQTLAIRTEMNAAPGDAAWVVPTPSVPELLEVAPGVIESARASFSPRVARDPSAPLLAFALLAVLLVAIVHAAVALGGGVWTKVAIVAALASALLLASSRTGRVRAAGAQAFAGVRLHERKLLGAHEVVVISSKDPAALSAWLNSSGFTLPKDAEGPVAEYCRQGWCFTAARLVEAVGAGVHTPAPVGLRFRTATPVYPMRLTAVGNAGSAPLDLELLVFGPGTASVPGMIVESSGSVEVLRLAGEWQVGWPADQIRESHAGVLELMEGAPWATKLRGAFPPEAMTQDLSPTFGPGTTVGRTVYTHEDRRARMSVAAAATLALIGAAVLPLTSRRRWTKRRAWAAVVVAGFACSIVAVLAVRGMPAVETGLIDSVRRGARIRSAWFDVVVASPPPTTVEQARAMFETAWREADGEAELPGYGAAPGQFSIHVVEHSLEFRWINEYGQQVTEFGPDLPKR